MLQELKMAAGQSPVAGMQASPPQSYVSPTHLSPSALGWSASTAGVTLPMTTTLDVKSTAADSRSVACYLFTLSGAELLVGVSQLAKHGTC